jgi:hypothetical protein
MSALAREGGWTARRRLHADLGGHVRAAALTAALESLNEREIVECRTVETASKPAEEWRLIQPLGDTEHTRANEQSEQLPWEVENLKESSESSYARDDGSTAPAPGTDSQVEYF